MNLNNKNHPVYEPEKWNKDWEKLYNTDSGDVIEVGPKPYFQMTLINPF